MPDCSRVVDGKVLQQSLSDYPELHMDVISVELTSYLGAVAIRCPVQILIATATSDRLHVGHPEMIGMSPQDVDSLFESDLNFETESIKLQDLHGFECEVGAE